VRRGSSSDTGAGYIPSMRAIAPAITLVIHPHVTSPQDRFARQICATARKAWFQEEMPVRAYTSLRQTHPVWYVMEGERAAQAVRRRATDSAYRDGAIARKSSKRSRRCQSCRTRKQKRTLRQRLPGIAGK
jgi:hypothetical protein